MAAIRYQRTLMMIRKVGRHVPGESMRTGNDSQAAILFQTLMVTVDSKVLFSVVRSAFQGEDSPVYIHSTLPWVCPELGSIIWVTNVGKMYWQDKRTTQHESSFNYIGSSQAKIESLMKAETKHAKVAVMQASVRSTNHCSSPDFLIKVLIDRCNSVSNNIMGQRHPISLSGSVLMSYRRFLVFLWKQKCGHSENKDDGRSDERYEDEDDRRWRNKMKMEVKKITPVETKKMRMRMNLHCGGGDDDRGWRRR
ncbi:hypothetical protein HPP92_029095 [Vanilla planifolia]|uniref:Uncharacterized protein n=1 Tax=Vanilla planifolia TaxID=51239 RepID=A0A835U1Z9_VANPL|nr:hypothetical protein HPP92_029095 [Vanilla planifolia]KAG0445933.1 hypothetical protein HPP92_029084 [Vanilla planifolia]